MKPTDVDQWLRDKAPYRANTVPHMVMQRMEQTLLTLPTRSKLRRNAMIRRLIWSAASFILLVGAFVATVRLSPQVSTELQRVPVMGNVVQKISEFRKWSVTDQEITLTVNRVRDDGFIVSADLSVRSLEKLEWTTMNYVLKMDDTIVTANGRPVQLGFPARILIRQKLTQTLQLNIPIPTG